MGKFYFFNFFILILIFLFFTIKFPYNFIFNNYKNFLNIYIFYKIYRRGAENARRIT